MFVAEARFGYIVLETVVGGDRYQLESFRGEGKSWWERARDLRLRKLQAKLKQLPHRRRSVYSKATNSHRRFVA
jgi:hypothetical protein